MKKYRNKKIGILGGSFDPVHEGHLAISKIAIKKIKLQKLYWIITKKNPFKRKPFFSLRKRVTEAKRICKSYKKIEVLYLDEKIRSSRSIKIIRYIIKNMKPKNLYFIVGSDILLKFHKWKSWKKIVELVKLVVFSRKGYDRNSKESTVVKYLNKNDITFIKNKPIKISSTTLRKKMIRSN